MIKRIVVWFVRKAIQWYPDEAFTPEGHHIHRNPTRKLKIVTYPMGKE